MALDSSKLYFSSTWDIDQIFSQAITNIAGSASSGVPLDVLITTHGLGYVPTFDFSFNSGTGGWQQAGNVDSNLLTYLPYATTTELHATVFNNSIGTVNFSTQLHYYIWTDTVVH